MGSNFRRFILGFAFPPLWYFATFLYYENQYLNDPYLKDPRERPGLAASAIAVRYHHYHHQLVSSHLSSSLKSQITGVAKRILIYLNTFSFRLFGVQNCIITVSFIIVLVNTFTICKNGLKRILSNAKLLFLLCFCLQALICSVSLLISGMIVLMCW